MLNFLQKQYDKDSSKWLLRNDKLQLNLRLTIHGDRLEHCSECSRMRNKSILVVLSVRFQDYSFNQWKLDKSFTYMKLLDLLYPNGKTWKAQVYIREPPYNRKFFK